MRKKVKKFFKYVGGNLKPPHINSLKITQNDNGKGVATLTVSDRLSYKETLVPVVGQREPMSLLRLEKENGK